jgi:predicted RNase H-like nuclease
MADDVNVLLVGIDCAVAETNIGLALAEYNGGGVRLRAATLCDSERPAAKTVVRWLTDARGQALLAIDAPLGWPVALAQSLVRHRAGEEIDSEPNVMFRRATDRFIGRELTTPLDVGADRIARTAHAALSLLSKVREGLGLEIPLAWALGTTAGTAAIEVYPAGTLVAHGFQSTCYKKREQVDGRRKILASLRSHIDVDDEHAAKLESNADALDAAVCVLAAKDFLDGRAFPPEDLELAAKEGWIWAYRRLKPNDR